MNFADALRMAKHESGDPVIPETHHPITTPVDVHHVSAQEVPEPMSQINHSVDLATGTPTGSIVRLELFLTPEQLSGLFRAVVAAQHSVMTLREAANYVRIPIHVLEELAREGDIPAFLVDGKWRFPRNGVDEWMSMQASKKEAS